MEVLVRIERLEIQGGGGGGSEGNLTTSLKCRLALVLHLVMAAEGGHAMGEMAELGTSVFFLLLNLRRRRRRRRLHQQETTLTGLQHPELQHSHQGRLRHVSVAILSSKIMPTFIFDILVFFYFGQ